MMTLASSVARPCTCAAGVRRSAPVNMPRIAQMGRRSLLVRAEKTDDKTWTENVDRSKIEQVEAGNLSNENAEKRADIGKDRLPNVSEVQSFDGPLPETINGRAAMLGVTSALAAELATGVGLKQQLAEAPLSILAAFIIIGIASSIPVLKGYTRKEPFANAFWSPKAENWNGRLAMVGFASLLLTEALTGQTTTQFWSNFFHL